MKRRDEQTRNKGWDGEGGGGAGKALRALGRAVQRLGGRKEQGMGVVVEAVGWSLALINPRLSNLGCLLEGWWGGDQGEP